MANCPKCEIKGITRPLRNRAPNKKGVTVSECVGRDTGDCNYWGSLGHIDTATEAREATQSAGTGTPDNGGNIDDGNDERNQPALEPAIEIEQHQGKPTGEPKPKRGFFSSLISGDDDD